MNPMMLMRMMTMKMMTVMMMMINLRKVMTIMITITMMIKKDHDLDDDHGGHDNDEQKDELMMFYGDVEYDDCR